jgi:hypothetical protein
VKRYRQIGRSGLRLKNSYDYEGSPGYLVEGLGQLTAEDRGEFQVAMVTGLLAQDLKAMRSS